MHPDPRGYALLLILASADMDEATAAAQAIKALRQTKVELPQHLLIRALEAGMFVCYARPFTRSNLGQLKPSDVPRGKRVLHERLLRLRKQVYAHTDKVPERTADVVRKGTDTRGRVMLDLTVHTADVPVELLDDVISLCTTQARTFVEKAGELMAKLELDEK
jgi:hypothetical protein